MIAYLLLCVYWFHPLVWLAYVLLCRDLELACDERVINKLDENERRAYAHALLHCGGRRLYFSACPIGFGETGVKERIKRVKMYQKPSLQIILLCIGLCALIAVCFLTNSSSSAISFEKVQLEIVKVTDLRTDTPISYDFYKAEMEELTWQLEKLKIGKECKTPYEPSPTYSLDIKMQDADLLILTGYESAEEYAVALYQEKYYRIDDSEFLEYLNNVCVGNQRTETEGQDATDGDITRTWVERQDATNGGITGSASDKFTSTAGTDANSQSESSSTGAETPADEIATGSTGHQNRNSPAGTEAPAGGIATGTDTGVQNESYPANTLEPETESVTIGGITEDDIAYIEVRNGNNGQLIRFTESDSNSMFKDLLNLYRQLDASGNAVQNNRSGYMYWMSLYDQNDILLQSVTPYTDGFAIDNMFFACDMTKDPASVNLMNYIDLLFYPGVSEVEMAREKLLFEILDELESLPYRDETCDGLPEISLQGNGTEYQVNLSERWVWKDNRETELSEGLAGKIQTMLIMK